MTWFQKIILIVVLAEAGVGIRVWQRQQGRFPLPAVNWAAMEPATAADIQQAEVARLADGNWFGLGDTYRAFGLLLQAECCYARAASFAPSNPELLYSWGVCLDQLGETGKATEKYEKILSLQPPVSRNIMNNCWLNIGQDRLREGRTDAAVPALEKALDLTKTRLLLSRLFLRSGRAAEAAALLDPVVARDPDQIDALQMRGWAAAELGKMPEAIRYGESTLRASRRPVLYDPTYPGIRAERDRTGSMRRFLKSVEAARAHNLPEAKSLAAEALSSMWTEDYALQLARIELEAGNAREATRLIDEGVEKVGWSMGSLSLRGDIALSGGDEAGAREFWERAFEFQASADLKRKIANSLERTGAIERARQARAKGDYEEGRAAWQRNDLPRALALLGKAVQGNENDAEAWFYLGETRRQLGLDQSAAAYERALALKPHHGRAATALQRMRP